ncbi:MAG: hypothetical protein IPK99_17775 [Flavobacteriales bacterium]|nr:hypothetical protein [Flavobacteriales bacterium]
MRTTKAGITWTPFPFPLGYLNDLQFINDSVGYFLSQDQLFWTNDGGSTLASQPIPQGFGMYQMHQARRNGLPLRRRERRTS